MNTHDIEQERQKFEAFMREKNPSHDLEHEFGIYRFSPVQRHWDTWQAAIEADHIRAEDYINDDRDQLRAEIVALRGTIADLEADRKRRGEPIGYIPKATVDWLTRPGRDKTAGCATSIDKTPMDSQGAVPLYTAPQPAEPSGASNLHKDSCGAQNENQAPQPAEPVKVPCPTYVCLAAQTDGVLCANDECDRESGVRPANPVKVPGDDEIMSIAALHETHGDAWQDAEYRFAEADFLAAARALLARYTTTQEQP